MRSLTVVLVTLAIATPATAQLPSRTYPNGMGGHDTYAPGQPLVPYRDGMGGAETYGPNGLHLRTWDDMSGTETYDDDDQQSPQQRPHALPPQAD